jgi:hypothetical protein
MYKFSLEIVVLAELPSAVVCPPSNSKEKPAA